MKNCFLILLSLLFSTSSVKSQQCINSRFGTNYFKFSNIETKPPANPLSRKLDFRIGYTRLSRQVIVTEDETDQLGHYQSNLSELNGNQFMIGIAVNQGRWVIPLELGLIQWDLKLDAYHRRNYFFKENSSGNAGFRTRYDEYHVNYTSNHTRFFISTGMGVKLFHPESIFNMIPSIRVNGSVFLKNQMITNSVTEHNYYKGENIPGPSGDFLHDTTYTYSITDELEMNLKSIRIGMSLSNIFRLNVSSQWIVDIELGLLIDPVSYLTYGMVTDKKSGFGNISIGYTIPLKDSK